MLLTIGSKAEEETQGPRLVSCCGSSVTSPFLSVCFRVSGLCRRMLASVFCREPLPIRPTKLTDGRAKKERHQHEFIKAFAHYHVSLFSLYVRCNKRHGGLSARNRWEAQRPLLAPTLGRRLGRGG